MVKPFIAKLGIVKDVNSEVSIITCISSMLTWLRSGEAIDVIAVAMLAIFAVALTVIDVLLLAWAAAMPTAAGAWALKASHIVGHVSMLDVFIMGIIVVCSVGEGYKSKGFEFVMRWGLAPLIGAEVAHYILYSSVQQSVSYARLKDVREEGQCEES